MAKSGALMLKHSTRPGTSFVQTRMASGVPPYTTTKVSPHLQLRQLEASVMRGRPNSLVLFFPWLYASRGAIDKYCDLYHSRGFDVLSVSCDLKHFLWPSTAKTLAKELLTYLVSSQVPMTMDKFFVHSTSIGAYVYTMVLMELASSQGKYASVSRKISGQIFDSITLGGLDRMANGIAQNYKSAIGQGMVKQTAHLYFALTSPWTVRLYNASVDHFKFSPLKCPSLYFYSLNDPMCDTDALDQMVTDWKDRLKIDVHVKCWPISKHALHMREHPEQYTKTLQFFLDHVGMNSTKIPDSKL